MQIPHSFPLTRSVEISPLSIALHAVTGHQLWVTISITITTISASKRISRRGQSSAETTKSKDGCNALARASSRIYQPITTPPFRQRLQLAARGVYGNHPRIIIYENQSALVTSPIILNRRKIGVTRHPCGYLCPTAITFPSVSDGVNVTNPAGYYNTTIAMRCETNSATQPLPSFVLDFERIAVTNTSSRIIW